MIFALCKFLGALFTILACGKIMLTSGDVTDVVKDYAAVAIIGELDSLLYTTIAAEDRVTDMKLLISRERMKISDYEMLKELSEAADNWEVKCYDNGKY